MTLTPLHCALLVASAVILAGVAAADLFTGGDKPRGR